MSTPLPRPLRGGVVTLDEPRDQDAERMLAAALDPMTRRPFGDSLPRTLEEAHRAINAARGLWREQGEHFDGRWAVRSGADPAFLGHLRLHAEGHGARVSAWIGPDARDRGLGTASVRLACGFAFEALRVPVVEAHITPDNDRSRSIVRGLGFGQRPGGGFTTSSDYAGMALVYQLARGMGPPADETSSEDELRTELAEAERELAKHDADPDGDAIVMGPPGPHEDIIRGYFREQRRADHVDRVERAKQRLRRAGLD